MREPTTLRHAAPIGLWSNPGAGHGAGRHLGPKSNRRGRRATLSSMPWHRAVRGAAPGSSPRRCSHGRHPFVSVHRDGRPSGRRGTRGLATGAGAAWKAPPHPQRRPSHPRHNGTNGAPAAAKPDAKPGRMTRKDYDKTIKKLHAELVKVQLWAKHTGAKYVVIFEGRDAAGKGGVIKALTAHPSAPFASPPYPPPPTAKRARCTCSGTSSISPPAARSSSSIAPGTTAPASRRSWDSVPRARWIDSWRCAPRSNVPSQAPGSRSLSTGSRSARTSRPAGSRNVSRTRGRSGSSARWTWSRTVGGTTTRAPRRDVPCDRHQ